MKKIYILIRCEVIMVPKSDSGGFDRLVKVVWGHTGQILGACDLKTRLRTLSLLEAKNLFEN